MSQTNITASLANTFNDYFDAKLKRHHYIAPPLEEFCAKRIFIRDMSHQIIPFKLNSIQRIHQKRKNDSVSKKFLLLKYRRGGFTTFEQAQSYYTVATQPYTTCVTLADNRQNTETIFRMVTRMLHLDEKAPTDQGESKSHIEFHGLDSVFHIGTAGTKAFGRGDDIKRVHGSEVAFWSGNYELIDNLIAGLTEACRNGEVVLETTANGAMGWFYEKYSEAMRGENDWTPLFYPWFMDSVNVIEGSRQEELAFLESITDEEKRVMEMHQLTFPQMLWRRKKQFSLKKLFQQEYPETWEQAFVVRGSTFFDQQMLSDLSKNVSPPLRVSDHLTIWKLPEKDVEYCAGSDTALGELESDNCTCGIINKGTGEQVAMLRGKWRPEVFARKAIKLCETYNNALFACELNNHGHSVMNTVINTLRYKHLFYYLRPLDKTKFGADQKEKRPGFLTTAQTRPILLDELNEALEEGYMKVNDTVFINEMKTFVDKGGKFQGDTGEHDDSIFAWGIAWQCRKQLKKSFIIV